VFSGLETGLEIAQDSLFAKSATLIFADAMRPRG